MINIGTRGSPLALAQAYETRDRLIAAHPKKLNNDTVNIIIIKTTGDKITDRPLGAIGGKGLFTKEIEEDLLANKIDIAVHSMKDMPTILPEGLEISCLLPREDPRDAFFSASGKSLMELPKGAIIGTASLRRQAQILNLRPDLKITLFRGNVQTRLKKLKAGEADATLLAAAGIKRLNMTHLATQILETKTMLPAVAQGAIGIETRIGDPRLLDFLAPINCEKTTIRLAAERAFLKALDGSCRTPIAGYATINDKKITLKAQVLSADGTKNFTDSQTVPLAEAAQMGKSLGNKIRAQLPEGFFETFTHT